MHAMAAVPGKAAGGGQRCRSRSEAILARDRASADDGSDPNGPVYDPHGSDAPDEQQTLVDEAGAAPSTHGSTNGGIKG